MLENEKTIQDLNLAAICADLLSDLPWNSLRDYLQANPQLLKRCTAGGHRLEGKHRKRCEAMIVKEAEKAEFAQTFCSTLFAYWYPVHEELHAKLEEYFHSDEYKKYREGKELSDDKYVLPDAEFEKFFEIKDLRQWRILLCFSPLEFSDAQAAQVVSQVGGNEELLKQLETIKSELQQLEKEKGLLANENQDIRTRFELITSEAQELRQERKKLKADRDALQQKFEAAQSENKKLRQEVGQHELSLHETRQTVHATKKEVTTRAEKEAQRIQNELSDWKAKYEKQRLETRQTQDQVKTLEKALAEERAKIIASKKEIKQAHSVVDAILARLDWAEVGKQLRLTPQLKVKFNSLIKKLRYDDERRLTLDDSLEGFWNTLQNEEKELVANMAKSDTREVQQGDVEGFWLSLTDSFEDVYIGLEARAILLKLLQEVFYQTIEMKDLERVAVPAGKRK